MTHPATPPQLAASGTEATRAAGREDDAAASAAAAKLGDLAAALHQAQANIDVEGKPQAEVDILVRWSDALRAARAAVAELRVRTGHGVGEGGGTLEGLRGIMARGDLRTLVRDGNRLLDLFAAAIEAQASDVPRQELQDHERIVVRIVNAAQDRLDGV
ncbi:hypothetical protein [Jannaschia marina]|uniref:hypothetical protein n=1 Tax=Jannaschia marina TaxID=2741674 RepID=UPI0015CB450A|nr:hypothetical protein [Jannaschia marina]